FFWRFFYQFLLGNERAAAQELREQYVDTMSKIYLSYFKSYTSRLMKIQYEEVAEKDDLMGVEDTAKKDILPPGGKRPSLKNRNTVFTLGNRGAVIGAAELEGPIIVPHAAQKSDVRYPFESLFRSQHYALLDNGCREYLFLCDFFMVAGPSAQDLFNAVMGKTLAMFLKHMEGYVCDCYDGIAVFLCIHIVLRFKAIMAKRNIPAVEKYWDALLELLWPRFEHILELNIQSIQNTDPQRLGFLDTRPHYITRRYAEFSSAIVSINQTFPNEKTHALLGQLQVEVENFVLRVAAEFSSRKEQLVFLINNYDMMLGVLMERAVEESKEVEGFQQLLSARTQEFIEEILSPPFGGMIAFVKEAEALIEKGQQERLRGEEGDTRVPLGWGGEWGEGRDPHGATGPPPRDKEPPQGWGTPPIGLGTGGGGTRNQPRRHPHVPPAFVPVPSPLPAPQRPRRAPNPPPKKRGDPSGTPPPSTSAPWWARSRAPAAC
uniref:VPS52 subunit of GARP complex n=1 Tax=Cairina moschata TaxID=8855 RepID=A0A8C3CPZ9_CAIMO